MGSGGGSLIPASQGCAGERLDPSRGEMLELGCSQRVSRLSWRTAGTAPTILPVVVMMIIANAYVEPSTLGLF